MRDWSSAPFADWASRKPSTIIQMPLDALCGSRNRPNAIRNQPKMRPSRATMRVARSCSPVRHQMKARAIRLPSSG